MTCRRLEEDDLLTGLGESLDDHVAQCAECSARTRGYRRIVGWIADGRPAYRPPADWQRRTLARVLASGGQLRSIPADATGAVAAEHSDAPTDRSAISPGATISGSPGTRPRATARPPRRPASRAVWPIVSAAIALVGLVAWAAWHGAPQPERVVVETNGRLTGEVGIMLGRGSVAAPGAPESLDHGGRPAGAEPIEPIEPVMPDSQEDPEHPIKRGGAIVLDWPSETTSAPVMLSFDPPGGRLGGLTVEEVRRVVEARMTVFRTCYEKSRQRSPGLHGTLLVILQIGGDGQVQAVDCPAPGSTLQGEAVAQCMRSEVKLLKFPAKGSVATVSYPFEFTQ